MISITIKNLAEFQKTISAYPEKSARNFNDAIKKSLLIIQRAATTRGRMPRDTGALASGWELNVGTLRGILKNKMQYAIFVHEGTGIFGPFKRPIVPKTKPFLAWQKDGIWHFAKSVRGMKARPFLQQAVTEKEEEVNKIFNEALVKTLKQV